MELPMKTLITKSGNFASKEIQQSMHVMPEILAIKINDNLNEILMLFFYLQQYNQLK